MEFKRLPILIWFLLLALPVLAAGNTTIDSLKKELKAAKHDSIRCQILQQLSEAESDDKIWPIYNDSVLAIALRNTARYPKGSPAYRTFRLFEANAINNIGYLASHRGNVSLSIEKIQKALSIYEELNVLTLKANSFNNLAFVYMNQKQNDKALEFYRKSYEIFAKEQDKTMTAIVLNNIGIAFNNKGINDSALYYYEWSLKIREKLGNIKNIATAYNNIGNLYKKMGRYDEAVSTLKKALALTEKVNDIDTRTNCLNNIGNCYLSQKDYKTALSYCEPAYELARKTGYPVLLQRCSSNLKDIYKNLGRYDKAYEMLEVFKQMSDSINKKEFREAVIRDEYRYEYGRKSTEDSIRRAAEKMIEQEQLTASEARVEQAKTQRFALYGGLFLVLVFAFFIFNRFRMTRKQNVIIQEQKKLVEAKNKNILDSINYARHIQEAILPTDSYFKSLLPDSFVIYKPKDIVSGDFYFAGSPVTGEGHKLVVVSVGDCTGHGVPGAFLTLLGKTFLQLGLEESSVNSCAEALDYLNKGLSGMLNKAAKGDLAVRDGMDISLCSINSATLMLEFAAAKNPVCIVRKKELFELKADKHAIGELVDASNQQLRYSNQYFQLEKGDCIYLFTDGYADQFGGPTAASGGKKFKYKPLTNLLVSFYDKPMPEQKKLLTTAFENWKGNLEQIDDICIVGIRV